MVEILVSSLVISFVAAGLIAMLSSLYRVNTASQNHILATTIMQEVMDNARNQSWNELQNQATKGWQPLLANAVTSGNVAPAAYPRPLLLDKVNKKYVSDVPGTDQSKSKLFRGEVRQLITSEDDDKVLLTVEIGFPTGRGNSKSTIRSQSVISKYGLHN